MNCIHSRLAALSALLWVLAGTAPAVALDLKIATVAPEGSSWMQDMRNAGRDIKTRTEGRVVLKFYGGGIQGNDKKVLRKIRIGQLHGGAFTPNGLVERYSDLELYGLPLLFDSQAEVDYVRARLDAPLVEGLRAAGFESYGFAGGGFAYLLTGRPAARLEDLDGQKVWVPEGDQSSYLAMQALGLAPIVLPVTDVMTGLETGLLDIVAAPPAVAIVLQWHTKTSYVTNYPLTYTMGLLAIDNRALARVSEPDRAVLSEVMSAIYRQFDADNRDGNEQAIAALKAGGIRFVDTEIADVSRWRQAVAGTADRLVAEGQLSADLLQQARGLISEFRNGQAGAAK